MTATMTAPIHVRIHRTSGTASVFDMTNAGKRGKVCQRLLIYVSHWAPGMARGDRIKETTEKHSNEILYYLDALPATSDFEGTRAEVLRMIEAARSDGVPHDYIRHYDEEVKGIDAPKPVLSAGVEGAWLAAADVNGIVLRDLKDINEWTEITHNQTSSKAYSIAQKVWDNVGKAKTLHEATTILRSAGARLHGFCAMD